MKKIKLLSILGLSIFTLFAFASSFFLSSAEARDYQDNTEFVAIDSPQANIEIALRYLDQNKDTLGLTAADLAEAKVTDSAVSRLSGVTHIHFIQQLEGIEVYNALINIGIMPDGSVLSVGNRFVPDLQSAVTSSKAQLTAAEAVEKAAEHLDLTLTEPIQAISPAKGADQETLLTDGGISQDNIPAKLVYDAAGEEVRLAWNVTIYQLDSLHWWNVRVDAANGQIISKNDWVVHENFDEHLTPQNLPADIETKEQTIPALGPTPVPDGSSYTVYHLPVEDPGHTSPAPPADGRTLEDEPADAVSSPYGWHDTDGASGAEYTITRGNNGHAYEDSGNNNGSIGNEPDGGAGLDFNFAITLTAAPSVYQLASTTNLFHWTNLMHDVTYRYGFDEVHGNFQENNYGNGGSGSDYVYAEGQDGSGNCNANFGTPGDGNNPRMQMYTCTNTSPARDGSLDNGVIAHEYGHGISNRMVGGPTNVGCLGNQEQMGEGWSDWQAVIMTMEDGDAGTDARGIGTWLFGQAPNGPGIRPAPYSTDFGVNNYTYGDLPGLAVPHGVGFMWTTMLWEMNWELINLYGFDEDIYLPDGPWTNWSGNQLANALVHEGFNNTPCGPGFVDGRDAILAADVAITGGVNQCTIWTAFARRGLGFSADQGSPNSSNDGTEAFDMPPACLTVDIAPASQDICQGSDALFTVSVGSDFTPPVTMSVDGNPAPTTATFSENPITTVPDSTDLTIGNTATAPSGEHTIVVSGTDTIVTHSVSAVLAIFSGVPGTAPTLTSPVDGATDVTTLPTFSWGAVADATSYDLQVATDAGFSTIVYSTTTTMTSQDLPLDAELEYGTDYYWRVKSDNVCGDGAFSAAFTFTTAQLPGTCAPGTAANVIYSYDFESGDMGWTHNATAGSDTWDLVSDYSSSGLFAFHSEDSSTLSDQRLMSPEITIGPADELPLTLRFENRQRFETPNTDGRCWDAGILEITTDGGATWSQVDASNMLTDPYDNILWNDTPGNNPISTDYGATDAWCSPDDEEFTLSVVDLEEYAGETVQFRWRMGTDSFVGGDGWWIDDVAVQSCELASGEEPFIEVSPEALTSTQATNTTITETLTISNTGSLDLNWSIYEDPATAFQGGVWADDFDSYATGSEMHGQGDWKGWDNDPSFGALTSDVVAASAPNSVDIFGTSDLVHEYSGYTSGAWTYRALQYIPSDFSGQTYFILLNTYNDGSPYDWSTQVNFNSGSNLVVNDGVSGGTLPMLTDQWVEIRVEIDLDADTQEFWYGGDLLYSGTWTAEQGAGGVLNIGAVDLYANSAGSVYYDNISLAPDIPANVCDAPGDISWATVSPTSGTTASGSSSEVAVGFDSTGLTTGVYTSTLCVDSNDPVSPLVPVPVTLTVSAAAPEISLVKTVGTDPGVCATTTAITVTVGTDVYYCYQVTNDGNATLNLHDLTDDQLGDIFTGFGYALNPGASVDTVAAGLVISATITEDTTNTATWTAYNAGPTDEAMAQATASVTAINPAISVVKTVGTEPGVCATTTAINVPAGTDVYYCYQVTNDGDVTLAMHDLTDDQLGDLLTDFAYDLDPGASVDTVAAGLVISATIMTDTTNTATWTASNADLNAEATAMASATVTVGEDMWYIYLPVISKP